MEILFITKLLPYPLDAGGKIRTFENLQILSKNHKIHLVGFVDNKTDLKWKKYLQKYCKKITVFVMPITNQYHKSLIFKFLLSLMSTKPFTVLKYYSHDMSLFISNELKNNNYDLLFIDHINISQYIPKNYNGKVICDEHDISSIAFSRYAVKENNSFLKLIYFLESKKLSYLEQQWVPQFDQIFSISQIDRERLIRLGAEPKKVTFLPTPFSVNYCYNFSQDQPTISFVGLLSWLPNESGIIWFIEKVYPLIQKYLPNIKLMIGGKFGDKIIKKIIKIQDKSIEYLGFVNDLKILYEKTTVFIVPILIGAGIRIKLLDAMSYGIPVVSTTIGVEGIEVHDGKEILLRDTPEDFADAVIRVIKDRSLATKLSKNGVNFLKKYTAEKAKEVLEIIEKV